jgi:hypothetical protein
MPPKRRNAVEVLRQIHDWSGSVKKGLAPYDANYMIAINKGIMWNILTFMELASNIFLGRTPITKEELEKASTMDWGDLGIDFEGEFKEQNPVVEVKGPTLDETLKELETEWTEGGTDDPNETEEKKGEGGGSGEPSSGPDDGDGPESPTPGMGD